MNSQETGRPSVRRTYANLGRDFAAAKSRKTAQSPIANLNSSPVAKRILKIAAASFAVIAVGWGASSAFAAIVPARAAKVPAKLESAAVDETKAAAEKAIAAFKRSPSEFRSSYQALDQKSMSLGMQALPALAASGLGECAAIADANDSSMRLLKARVRGAFSVVFAFRKDSASNELQLVGLRPEMH